MFTPASPGFQAFVAYGAAAAYKTVQDDPEAAGVLSATSSAALLGYGYAAALGLGAAGAAVGAALPASTFTALFPYILYLGDWTLAGAGAAACRPARPPVRSAAAASAARYWS